jgi:predicted dehydrogenase
MAHEARERIAAGEIGKLRLVQMEYASAGRSTLVEEQGDERTKWRMDPAIGGPSSVLGDIGTHAHHLARFMTGLEVEEVSADIQTFVTGRKGDDNAEVNLRFTDGVRGHLWASVIAAGLGNGLVIRIFGDRGSIQWQQETPNEMWLRPLTDSPRLLRRGEAWLGEESRRTSRMRLGHPQGVLEAFANFYLDSANGIRQVQETGRLPANIPIATAYDGALGMKFVEACVESSKQNGRWTDATADLANPSDD